jgi:hypothetical protein
MFSDAKYKSFVIQERLKNHSDLTRLSDTESLQTVRIITYVDSDVKCNILFAELKIIVGQNVIDNIQDGRIGNVEAEISLSDGVLNPAILITLDGSRPKTVLAHPKTGNSFEEFRVPFWSDVCWLVKETALKFLPLRTIGWDVALTPKGPFIVEGNMRWDPENACRRMDHILNALFRS